MKRHWSREYRHIRHTDCKQPATGMARGHENRALAEESTKRLARLENGREESTNEPNNVDERSTNRDGPSQVTPRHKSVTPNQPSRYRDRVAGGCRRPNRRRSERNPNMGELRVANPIRGRVKGSLVLTTADCGSATP